RILAHFRPAGRLFLNSRGKPWTSNAIRCQMRFLRDKLDLPSGVCAYAFRHTFTTDALESGIDTSTVAALLGHTSTAMIDRHYGHLDQRSHHLKQSMHQAAAKRARRQSA